MEQVHTKIISGIGIIDIKSQNNFNVRNKDLHEMIFYNISNFQENSDVKTILIKGSVNAFHVGDNLKEVNEFIKQDRLSALKPIIKLYLSIIDSKKPCVIYAPGKVSGVGFPFCLLFDKCLVDRSTKFSMPELRHGITSILGSGVIKGSLGTNYARQIFYFDEELSFDHAIVRSFSHNLALKTPSDIHILKEAKDLEEIGCQRSFYSTKTVINRNLRREILEAMSYYGIRDIISSPIFK